MRRFTVRLYFLTPFVLSCTFCGFLYTFCDLFINWDTVLIDFVVYQVQATDGDKDRPQNIVYFLTGQGVDPDNPENNKFAINRTTGEIYVLRVSSQLLILV